MKVYKSRTPHAYFGLLALSMILLLPISSMASRIQLLNDDQVLLDCVEWVLQSPRVTSRTKAIALCKDGATKKCMELAYKSTSVTSRDQAAEICSRK